VPAKEHAPWNRGLPGKPAMGQSKPEPENGLDRHLNINTASAHERPANVGSEDPVAVEENPYLNLVLGQMNALAGAMSIAAPASQELKVSDSRPLETEDSEKFPDSVESIGAETVDEVLKIPAGEILYAETLTAVDSRRQTPVAAVVVQGPLAGSKLIGGFSTHSGAKGLYLEFSGFADKAGEFHEIDAVAIDGFTASAAVASDINDSLLSRLGRELAATFVADLAKHASQPGRSVIEIGGNPAIIYDKPGIRESLFAGIGSAADKIKSELNSTSSSKPVISLRAGHPIGVLFLSPLEPGRVN
ncbi:MAG: DotG/IcmE/VirB10 family protein, partial [Albidovulum sp.]|nr:DotG/IcmE/VirB10 family protein [Albidovulum sp.]